MSGLIFIGADRNRRNKPPAGIRYQARRSINYDIQNGQTHLVIELYWCGHLLSSARRIGSFLGGLQTYSGRPVRPGAARWQSLPAVVLPTVAPVRNGQSRTWSENHRANHLSRERALMLRADGQSFRLSVEVASSSMTVNYANDTCRSRRSYVDSAIVSWKRGFPGDEPNTLWIGEIVSTISSGPPDEETVALGAVLAMATSAAAQQGIKQTDRVVKRAEDTMKQIAETKTELRKTHDTYNTLVKGGLGDAGNRGK